MSELVDPEESGKIIGYNPQTERAINVVNMLKERERDIADLWAEILMDDELSPDVRQMDMARSHIEDAFMHLVRAVFKPDDPFGWRV